MRRNFKGSKEENQRESGGSSKGVRRKFKGNQEEVQRESGGSSKGIRRKLKRSQEEIHMQSCGYLKGTKNWGDFAECFCRGCIVGWSVSVEGV